MIAAFDIALSGLAAAARRTANAANNIVNVRSTGAAHPGDPTGYTPQRTAQVSLATGGTRALSLPLIPPSIESFEPDSPDAGPDGIVLRPRVSLEFEIVELGVAARAYEASLAVIRTANQMSRALLDSLS